MSTLIYKTDDHVFIPRQGVARITNRETIEAGGLSSECFVTEFIPGFLISSHEKTRPSIKVNVIHAHKRFFPLPDQKIFSDAFQTAADTPKQDRRLWRLKKETYEARLASGDLLSIAKVYRDTKVNDQEDETAEDISTSRRELKEEALRTLSVCYAHAFEIPLNSAQEIVNIALGNQAPAPDKDTEEPSSVSETPIDEDETDIEVYEPETPAPAPDVFTNNIPDHHPALTPVPKETPEIPVIRDTRALGIPLKIIFKTNMFSEHTKSVIQRNTQMGTLEQLFNHARSKEWLEHAQDMYKIDTVQAEAIRTDVVQAVYKLAKTISLS